MSSQTKLIKDILSSYDAILENKNFLIKELNLIQLKKTDYPNVKFDDDGTQYDSVNKSLLDDLQSAAESVGIVATITTAKSGHPATVQGSNTPSRHMDGTGVDISILNGIGSGGATNATNGNSQFRELGHKLKNVLVSMGYVLNKESGNSKAVFWQTNEGGNHFNHLHVSNQNDTPTEPETTNTSTTGSTETDDSTSRNQKFISRIAKPLLKAIGIEEQHSHTSNKSLKSKEKKVNENIEKIKKLLK